MGMYDQIKINVFYSDDKYTKSAEVVLRCSPVIGQQICLFNSHYMNNNTLTCYKTVEKVYHIANNEYDVLVNPMSKSN